MAAGCGSSASNTSPPADPAAGETSSTTEVSVAAEQSTEPAVLTIAEMRISAEGDDGALVIEADGTMVMQGVFVGKLNGDGRVTNRAGKAIARIAEDGAVTIENFPPIFTIAEDGGLQFGDRALAIAEDGTLSGLGPDARVKFAGPKEGRRAAMLAFLLAMTAGAGDGGSLSPAPAGGGD